MGGEAGTELEPAVLRRRPGSTSCWGHSYRPSARFHSLANDHIELVTPRNEFLPTSDGSSRFCCLLLNTDQSNTLLKSSSPQCVLEDGTEPSHVQPSRECQPWAPWEQNTITVVPRDMGQCHPATV